MNTLKGHRRTLALVAAGVMVGTILFTPASAHVGGTVAHLWTTHLLPQAKRVFYTKSQSDARYLAKSDKAANADLLDGQDSAAFAPAGHNHDGAYAGPLNYQHVSTQITVPVTISHFVTLDCPAGKKVLSGGFNMNEPSVIRASNPFDDDTWAFRLRNDGPNTPLANLHVICISA